MTLIEMAEKSRASTRHAILTAIRAEPGIYGVPLRSAVSASLGHEISYGLLYATLDALEDEGWIAGQVIDGGTERGNRKKLGWHIRKAID